MHIPVCHRPACYTPPGPAAACLPRPAQRLEQPGQIVVVELVHQREQLAQPPWRETLAGEPRGSIRQIRDHRPLYLPKGISRSSSTQVFRIHPFDRFFRAHPHFRAQLRARPRAPTLHSPTR